MDDYPYKRYFIKDVGKLFHNAQMSKPLLRRIDKIFLKNVKTTLKWSDFIKLFPLTYTLNNVTGYYIISTLPTDYNNINILTDYYTEYARIRDIGAYQDISSHEYWNENKKSIINSVRTKDPETLREELYKRFKYEPRLEKISGYITLYDIFKPKIILDVSAAWGDRVIAALASKHVEAYVGVDPHSLLPEGWKNIFQDLIPLSGKNKDNFIFINEPFEPDSTVIPYYGRYDMVTMSQPPFTGDRYDLENLKQAAVKNKTLKKYITNFLIPYIKKACGALKDGGFLCCKFLDRKEYQISEFQLALTQWIDPRMHYRGAIYWEGDSKSLTPWWIYQRRNKVISEDRMLEIKKLLKFYKSYL